MLLETLWAGGAAQAEQFGIQLDKRMDVSNKAQLVRVPEKVENL